MHGTSLFGISSTIILWNIEHTTHQQINRTRYKLLLMFWFTRKDYRKLHSQYIRETAQKWICRPSLRDKFTHGCSSLVLAHKLHWRTHTCTCWQEKKATQKDRGFDLSGAEDYILGMTPDTLEAASVADTSKHTDVVDASARWTKGSNRQQPLSSCSRGGHIIDHIPSWADGKGNTRIVRPRLQRDNYLVWSKITLSNMIIWFHQRSNFTKIHL